MKKSYQNIEHKREDGSIWFNDLKRKREEGPALNKHRYTEFSDATKSVHAGQYDDPNTGALGTPIFQCSTFYLKETSYQAIEEGRGRDEMIYTRYGNPSQWSVQEKLSALENAESSIVFTSGMAAISSTLLAMLDKGSHIVSSRDIYGGTYNFLYEDLDRYGMSVTFTSPTNIKEIESAIQEDTKILYFEALTNPLLKITPIKALVALGKKYNLRVIIDNTFLTPYNVKLLDLGVDLVVNSATKYLNGHSDLIGGTVSGSRKLVDRIWPQMLKNGGSMDPHACFLLERSLKTFALRMKTHNANAMELATYLEAHTKIKKVYYPGLASHEQHSLAKSQLKGKNSGMISFEIEGGDTKAHQLLSFLKLPKEATSLGGVESLISLPYNTSQASLTKEQQKAIGINDGLIRLSVGVEDINDIISDFNQAISKTFKS
ncbi:aminotransferase class I/II-fold pyridoxal phosphate-dependent enzyme [uncultured Lacinutrix sp.]|uniref:trans-sulfuration enzyme family protein n=1 Tax=uncultured Lacinutrix sp. TaxID=574032 RepID=UPI002633F5BA|nr:aminotransferase class I/II-fold pyridoxal phosphate-dependent enzyme [uncultured Lacinutrix sp.]